MKVTLSIPSLADEPEEVKAWLRHAEKAIEAELAAAELNMLVYGVHVTWLPKAGPNELETKA